VEWIIFQDAVASILDLGCKLQGQCFLLYGISNEKPLNVDKGSTADHKFAIIN
jgi:hypothetical protein